MSSTELSAPPRRLRRVALGVVLAAQLAFFLLFVPRTPAVEADNVRYETPGWLLATGHGLSLPWNMYQDPDTRAWACDRHPESCPDDLAPTAMYAPGYQIHIAAVYLVAGRNLWAVLVTHLALLLGMFAAFEAVLAKRAGTVGYVFGIVAMASYPFLARQAGAIASDHLHAALLMFSLAALDLMRAGVRRGLVAGGLFAAATLTRPYSVMCIPFLVGALALQREPRISRGELVAFCAGIFLPCAAWATRNELVFGRFIPFTTTGLGASLYLNKLEWTIGSGLEPQNVKPILDELTRVAGGGDFTRWAASKPLSDAAKAWMIENPGKFLVAVLLRIPRVWISMGSTAVGGVSRAWPLLVGYLGLLLGLGVGGIWLRRKDRSTWMYAVVILTYWAFLLHTPGEARRTLPLRLPMLLFAAYAVDATALRRVLEPLVRRVTGRLVEAT